MHYLKNELYSLIKKDSSIFEFLLSGSLDGVWYWDLENPENEWMSPQYWYTLGYDPQEKKHLTSEWQNLIHPDDLNNALANFKKHCADPKHPYDQVVRYRHKNGSTVWVRCRGIAIRDETGKPVRMLGAHNDLTKEKQAEEQLKLERYQLKSIFDTIPAVIDIVDLATNEIVFMNKYTMDLYGSNGTGKKCYKVFHNYKNPCSFCNNRELLRKGFNEIIQWEYFSETLNRSFMTTNRLLKWSDGRAVKLELSIDVSDLKKVETQLHQAQKMESVGRLAGGVAHDFNNMLGVILGHTELALLQADENHDLYSDLKEIQKAAKRSADITKQLLAFARKQTISPRQLDLNDTVESMLNMLRRLIGEDIDLVWQPAAHIWPVKMDPSQIDQILANLCINARDAIAGVGKLTIETGMKTFDPAYCADHPGFIPGDFVMLAVSDNGCGMDKDTMDNIFEPFFTTKEGDKGTGLGLATIYGICKQNSGFINVYSEPGRGSTFKIFLPRLVAEEDTDKAVPEKRAAAGGTETILLVEDEPSILRMTRMMLERNGYSVLSAATPVKAIEKAKKHSGAINLLMTDVVMPEMNGRDLAGQITLLYPRICLLFMSGYTADVIAHQGVLDDGVAFIQKPFSMADMTEKVREVLDMPPDKN